LLTLVQFLNSTDSEGDMMQDQQAYFVLFQGARVFSPQDLGTQDVLVAGERVAAIGTHLELPSSWPVRVVDLKGYYLLPGLIDAHVHIIGGGGEGGFATRTPEAYLSAITSAGVTTVVGVLGTDGITRHMAGLLAKARGLEAEGISTFIYTGAYEVPTRTITGSVRSDLILIDKVIGTGEIAISDHRSAQPLLEDIKKLAAEARVGGMLAGKAGVVHLHLGDGSSGLAMLFQIVEETELPAGQFLPTHVNRNPWLFADAIAWGKKGGAVDVTSGVSPAGGMARAIKPSRAIKQAIVEGVPLTNITMSSDGFGSAPVFGPNGELVGLTVGKQDSLIQELRDLVQQEGLPLEQAVQVVTSNVARVLKLPRKGVIQIGSDADFAVFTPELELEQVWARGRLMVDAGKPVVFGTFEQSLG
jgi:beta-aspartyl-dipeptidase (metallo-type)